ncbi:MAG TPA: dihydrofolate reductase family protein, partial [Thermoanaerobaculia bacterium]
TFHAMTGEPGGEDGLDERFMQAGNENIGATVMGRNMFGPVRGPWAGSDWKGWWGDEPPYHHPVFVLTHHPHEPIPMRGGTTFHFVTEGARAALDRAFAAAGGKDVRLGGGAATIQEYLRAGLVDELHIAIVPLLLGDGERLFDGLEGGDTGLRCVELVSSDAVVHARLARQV